MVGVDHVLRTPTPTPTTIYPWVLWGNGVFELISSDPDIVCKQSVLGHQCQQIIGAIFVRMVMTPHVRKPVEFIGDGYTTKILFEKNKISCQLMPRRRALPAHHRAENSSPKSPAWSGSWQCVCKARAAWRSARAHRPVSDDFRHCPQTHRQCQFGQTCWKIMFLEQRERELPEIGQ